MSACHPFRPVPGQCGPNRRGPLPAPPFDPRDYWATRKCVSRLFASLETKLDKADVVDPGAEAEAGQAADAKSTHEELNRILGVASDARVLAESKADRATTLAGYGITDAATKAELDDKADLVGGKVPAAQLPSYVDDVLEYGSKSEFPASGENSKIYVAKDTNLVYRWSGTQYVEISPSPTLDDTVTEASPNGVKSSGIWSWVKSLLPQWLKSDYAEPATVASVANKRDKTDLAVYGFTEWTFAPALPDSYEIRYRDDGKWGVYYNGSVAGAVKGSYDSLEISWDGNEWGGGYPFTATRSRIQTADTLATTNGVNAAIEAHHDDTKRDLTDNTCRKTEFGEWVANINIPDDVNAQPEYSETERVWFWYRKSGRNPEDRFAVSEEATDNKDSELTFFEIVDSVPIGPTFTATRSSVCTDGKKFVTSDVVDGKVSSAVSTNNPSFVSAVRNTPTDNMPEDMPTDWGTYGTVGAALAALAAFVKWAKAKIVAVIGNDGKPTDQFATDLLGKQVAKDAIDAEIIEKGTAPDAHLEAPTDERLKLILAGNSVAYDSAKALPYKLASVIGDRVVATMTLTAASTDITLPTIAANDTTVKDFILDVTNAYAVEGVATDAGINIPRTDFKLVTRDGESLTDVTTVKAGKSAFICFTQKAPVVVDGTTYPCWCVIQLPFGDPS